MPTAAALLEARVLSTVVRVNFAAYPNFGFPPKRK
jgi:hypothetical protein